MDRLAFNAAVAMNEQTLGRQMSVNELANATTTGFKRSFEAAMRTIKVEGPGFQSRMQPQAFTQDFINLKPGTAMSTGNELDVALNDQSVLGVSAPNGALAFTRRGDLRINSAGALENGAGHLVKSQGGGNITIPPGFMVSISDSGAIFATDPSQAGVAQPVLVATMMLRDASKTPLERREDGLFQVVGKPGADVPNGPVLPTLTARSLEGSNVNPIEVMVKLLEQSRSFEQQVNIIKQSKEADEAGASMMKGA